ncbi:MAG: deoxyhypusine synthase [Ignavibacteria bacterium]|nr:deoxyhypusine synthase [Ignavibacteria bacterium]
MPQKSTFLRGRRIIPNPIGKNVGVGDLVETYFQAYNAGRLSEACRLFVTSMLKNDVTVGMSIAGALTPAGLGGSCVVPMMEAGFIDWIVSTGANLYHDSHFAIGLSLHQGSPFVDDKLLKRESVIRIYDVVFDYNVLVSTDEFYRRLFAGPEFQKVMSTSEFHYKIGKYLLERESVLNLSHSSILATGFKYKIPIYTSSPGDSAIGMNAAEAALYGGKCGFDVIADVNETSAIVLEAKRKGGKSGVLILGGGSPKNFLLQTEPQIQEVLKIDEKGHDYFIQFTDARPDTGGLSGATPSEAVSWGKIDPSKLSDTVVSYVDSTIAMPIFASYALWKRKPRRHKRLYFKREELLRHLARAAARARKRSSRRTDVPPHIH